MTIRPLPKTLGDLGSDWRLAFHCATCGHFSGPATFHLKRRWGDAMKLVDMLPLLRCARAGGAVHECFIVVEPEWLNGRSAFWEHQYQLRRGQPWSPFKRG